MASFQEITEYTPAAPWRCSTTAAGRTCNPCKEDALLAQQIRQAEESLARLKTKQLSNNAKMNQAHDPLSRLPVELMSHIFLDLRPPQADLGYHIETHGQADVIVKSTKTPLLIGGVCKAWRDVAWSMPLLWTTIAINIYNRHDGIADIIQPWLTRSGQLPLSMYLYGARNLAPGNETFSYTAMRQEEPKYLKKLMDLLGAYSKRWLYLNVAISEHIVAHSVDLSDVPVLETLTLLSDDAGDFDYLSVDHLQGNPAAGKIDVGKAPKLRNICLSGLMYYKVRVDWRNITRIHIKPPASFFDGLSTYELLQSTPSLTHFAVDNLSHFRENRSLPQTTLHLNHLVSLGIPLLMNSYKEANILLAHLIVPVLEELYIHTGDGISLASVNDLLLRSSSTLKTCGFEIHRNFQKTIAKLISFLEGKPSIESLHLCYRKVPSDMPWLPSTPTVQEKNNTNNEPPFLPNLRNMHVETHYDQGSYFNSLELLPRLNSPTHTSLEQSYGHGNTQLSSTLFRPFYIYCLLNPYTQRALQPIIEGSFSATPFAKDLVPFTSFLRHSLRHYAFELKILSPSARPSVRCIGDDL